MNDRVELIRERLTGAFAPSTLDIQDDSAKHAGHAGARAGGGHVNVRIVAAAFAGKSAIERHRMVYAALGDAAGWAACVGDGATPLSLARR